MKNWYESKTVWFNIITTLGAIVPIIGLFLKTIQPNTALTVDACVALVGSIGNVILRVWFTEAAVDHGQ